MSVELQVGFSPCPNDTFMFHALVHGLVKVDGVRFAPVLLDIETLNQRALDPERRLAVTKLSLPALARCSDHYRVLSAGAALGRGCGPLVVRAAARTELRELGDLRHQRVAIPGELTTAFLLLRCFGPAAFETVTMGFEQILPAVARGAVDAGLVIHESRFTFADHGLVRVADLGALWEADTGLPLPLGVICAARELGEDLCLGLEKGLRRSIEAARRDPAASWSYVREHSQELSRAVCEQHIALYVNEFSVDLGAAGRRAIATLLERGAAVGFLPRGAAAPW
jgi:1,4-dihydroxy-6-naphthoate synthase